MKPLYVIWVRSFWGSVTSPVSPGTDGKQGGRLWTKQWDEMHTDLSSSEGKCSYATNFLFSVTCPDYCIVVLCDPGYYELSSKRISSVTWHVQPHTLWKAECTNVGDSLKPSAVTGPCPVHLKIFFWPQAESCHMHSASFREGHGAAHC